MKPEIFDANNIRAAAQLLQRATIPPYAADRFDYDGQRRLAAFYRELDAAMGARLMLSNSDPKNNDPDDDFFDALYAGSRIRRVSASRMINSVAAGRRHASATITSHQIRARRRLPGLGAGEVAEPAPGTVRS